MKIYLASRYGRRLEMLRYAEQLRALGHEVTSTWIDGAHEAADATATDNQRCLWAMDDLTDIDRSQLLIAFTEEPGTAGGGRGGRHVEMGYALGCGMMVWVVGPRENVFCYLGEVSHFPTWADCLAHLEAVRRRAGERGE